MDGPHIRGFSPATLSIILTIALASARLVGSVMALINADTLKLVGLVLLSAISPAFRTQGKPVLGDARSGRDSNVHYRLELCRVPGLPE